MPLGLLSTALVSLFLGLAAPQNASAVTIGLMSADNSWQEEDAWNVMQRSGAKIFRAHIRASDLSDPTAWSKVEAMFGFAAKRDITILPYLYGRPGNGSQQFPTESEWSPPGNPWEYFVYAIVQRFGYSGSFWSDNPSIPYKPVTAWEVWNEPNLPKNNPQLTKKQCEEAGRKLFYNEDGSFNNCVQPQNYARFLKRTAAAIQAAQKLRTPGSGTQVLFGGLYSNAGGMGVSEFLEQAHSVSETGLAFNGLSLHPYSFQGGSWGVEQYVNEARNKLNSLLWTGKSLWITELGWNVEPWGNKYHLPVFEDQQRTYLEGSFNWIKSVAAAKNIPVLIWYMFRDNPVDSSWDHHSGLRRADGTYRPAWYAFQTQTGASHWPIKWYLDNLGGSIVSDPSISSWGYGRLDFFGRGTNNHLMHKWYDGNFSGWEDLGGSPASSPDAASWGANRIDVVARATDSSLLHWAWNGSGWYLDNLGGSIVSDPSISSWGYGRLDFFGRGTNNHLMHKWYDGNFSGWEDLGGSLVSGPDAVSWGPNRIDVVGRAADGSVSHWAWNGSTWTIDNLGGSIVSDPSISSWGYGRLDFFGRGTNNHLMHKWYDGNFSGWEDLGGSLVSGPDAVSWGPNRIDLLHRASDGSVGHWAGVAD